MHNAYTLSTIVHTCLLAVKMVPSTPPTLFKVVRTCAHAFPPLLFAAAVIFLASGCTNTAEPVTLSVALSGSPETLDPHATTSTLTFQVLRSIYDTLLEPDSNGELVAGLAEEWEFSNNARRLYLKLREGVYFHNGDEYTSADVEGTLQRLRAQSSPRASEYQNIADINIIDAHQLYINLHKPQSSLLATLASGWSAIVPKNLIDSEHNFATTPIGSGPFSFSEWQMGSRISLQKNDRYWRETKSNIQHIDFNIITENIVRVQGLIQNSIDVVDLIDPVDIPLLSAHEDIIVHRALSSLTMVLAFNTSDPLLSDVRVRRAISHAIDKERILDETYGGGVPITTFMDYSDPYYPNIAEQYGYNPSRARALLAQSGILSRIESPLIISVPQNFEPHVRAAELYQQMLSEVGIDSELALIDWPTWISRVYTAADYQLTVIGHTGHLDPAPRFGEYGYTQFENRQLAVLVEQAAAEIDQSRRTALYARALDIFAQELPFVFTGTNYRHIVTRKEITGVAVDTKLDTFDFRNTTKM